MSATQITRFPLFRRAILWCTALVVLATAQYGVHGRGAAAGAASAAPAQAVTQSVGTLDTVHYIPPLYAVSGLGTDGSSIDRHYLALSTPSTLPIVVHISTKSGLSKDVTISKSTPVTVELSAGQYGTVQYGARGIVDDSGLNTVNTKDGLILTADEPFYAAIRHLSTAQAESLTAKGQTALGTRFRAGFMRASEVATQNSELRSHFISVMASQDGTVVTFDNLRAGLVFYGVVGTPAPVTLNRGESYVIGVRFVDIAANLRNALNGALITATKPVAMNSGSWMSGGGGEGVNNGQDIGFDQSLPASLVGTEYILAKGSASGAAAAVLEVPIVIADSDNTQVFVNGSATPIATLNAGEYVQIPGTHFISSSMYLRATQPVYVYQSTAGNNAAANIGMSLAVGLSDGIRPQEVVIGSVDQLGPATMSIVVRTGAPISLACTGPCPLGPREAVVGGPGFDVLRQSVNGNVSVSSPEPMFISVINRSGVATASSYFSGVPNTFAVDDTAVTGLNTRVIIPVLANDNTGAGTFTITSATSPAHGIKAILQNGTIRYTPDVGFSGVDQFDYTITSGSISSTATVTVDVLPNVYNFAQPSFQVSRPEFATATNVVTVVREGDLSVTGAIEVSLFPGASTPATPGQDYLAGPIALTFAQWQDTVTVQIELLHDPTNTTDETISLSLTGAGVGQTQPTATLTLTLVVPNTPPTVTVPANITVEATGASGAVVAFTATATDGEDGAIAAACAPASGATFALSTTTVSCTATDSDGATDSATFTVTVVDTTAPTIAAMSDRSVPAAGAAGATVTYVAPATSDLVDGAGVTACAPSSGSVFPIGGTQVQCTATDTAGNTASKIFTVTVSDNTAPTIAAMGDMTTDATSAAGAPIAYTLPAAIDQVDPVPVVVCAPPSGSEFPVGTTTVTCVATDASGNAASTSFNVTVVPPVLDVLSISMETRRWPNSPIPTSATDAATIYHALPVGVAGYAPGPKGLSMFSNVNNANVFGGVNNQIGTSHRIVITAPVAGPLSIRVGIDSHRGAVLQVNGDVLDFRNTDIYDPTFTNPAQFLAATVTVVAGTNVIEAYGFDNCCDGPARAEYSYFGQPYRVFQAPANDVPTVVVTGPSPASYTSTQTYAFTVTDDGASFSVVEVSCGLRGDLVGPVTLTPAGGSFDCALHTPGVSLVTVQVDDDRGARSSTAALAVSVINSTPTITVPANQTREATGASGSEAMFTATANDTEDGALTPVCAPVSGSMFPLGTTVVSCTATDSAGATASGSFSVTVQDTTAPTLAGVANISVSATSAAGAVVTFSSPVATDAVDAAPAVTCAPASGSTFAIGATTVTCVATDARGNSAAATFTVTVTNTAPTFIPPSGSLTQFLQQAYTKASNTGENDYFGYAVAVSGDTMVVGAPYEGSAATGVNGDGANNGASLSGAAYVFVRSGATWAQQAYLKASNTGSNDYFGWSVAVSGDTVVVGAPGEESTAAGVNGDGANNSASLSGAAYVFVRSGATWAQQAYLKASNTGSDDYFGWSVAVSGDTVVVGAPNEDSAATGVNGAGANNSAFSSGAAYVFVRSGTTWAQQAYLKASNTGWFDNFGASVAVSGDTVVVGAPNEGSAATGVNGAGANNNASYSGAAYVFVRSGTTWAQQAYLKASNTGASDLFGSSVAVSGDTVVVGARYESSTATGVNGDGLNNSTIDSGAAYVFVRSGTTWAQQAYLKASNTGASDLFGSSVAVSGDTVVVGAPNEGSAATGVNGDGEDNSASISGAAYVFVRSGTTWAQQAYLKASNTGSNDSFGYAVAVSGDTVVVGAFGEASGATGVNGNGEDNSAGNSGAAYVLVNVHGELAQVEATSAAGASVTYAAAGADAEDGAITPVCAPASGATFPLGTTTVNCTVTDSAGGTASGSFEVTVVDTTAPMIAAMGDLSVAATSAAGAAVTYTAAATSDLVDGAGTVTCALASGSTFAIGATTVTCTATDAAGNLASSTFTVTVTNNAPTFTAPASQTVEATSAAGAMVTFAAAGNDVEDGAVAASCSAASGSAFALGTTTVNCTVTDEAGATASGSFDVTVVDTTAPSIAATADISAAATSAAGAAVTYTAAATSDLVDGAGTATCAPASGSTFAIGATSVTCTATDAAGNTASSTFTVTVTNNAPTFTAPANQTVAATSATGAVATFTAVGADVEDGAVPAVCTLASGSTFALGTTTVSCTVTDTAGATASDTFDVTVVDTTAPTIVYTGNAGTYQVSETVNITCAATDAVSVATTTCANITGPATGFLVGANTVTSTATDAAGNTTTMSVTFTVVVTSTGLQNLITQIAGASAPQLVSAVQNIAAAPNANARAGRVTAFRNQVNAQLKSGKITIEQAALLNTLVGSMN